MCPAINYLVFIWKCSSPTLSRPLGSSVGTWWCMVASSPQKAVHSNLWSPGARLKMGAWSRSFRRRQVVQLFPITLLPCSMMTFSSSWEGGMEKQDAPRYFANSLRILFVRKSHHLMLIQPLSLFVVCM